MSNTAAVGAKLSLSGVLEFKDAEGNVLKRVPFSGSVPLEETGLSAEQAQELINQQEANHGCDDCE